MKLESKNNINNKSLVLAKLLFKSNFKKYIVNINYFISKSINTVDLIMHIKQYMREQNEKNIHINHH